MVTEAEVELENPLMTIAWRDFIMFARFHEPTIEMFENDTGYKLANQPKSALDAAIDKATGYQDKIAKLFVLWATEKLWGTEGVPQAVLNDIAAARARAEKP
jgi:hypothetical protein